MQRNYMPHIALLAVVLFFCTLFWFDTLPAYTQVDPNNISQLTSAHSGPVGGAPGGFTELNGAIYFGLRSEKGGLWKTDGTAQGTVLVKDIKVDTYSLQRVGEMLYFTVEEDYSNSALWKSDGTTAGTVLVKANLRPWTKFVVLGEAIYFGAYEPVYGSELWKSDGTSEGTTVVADLRPGTEGSFPGELIVHNDLIYFEAFDPDSSVSVLMQSNGTREGTHVVAQSPRWPHSFVALADALYFIATDNEHGDELWRYGAGDAQPVLVADINPGIDSSYIGNMVVYKDRLYFGAEDADYQRQLWQSDGTAAGTFAVTDKELFLDVYSSPDLTEMNGMLYFAASSNEFGSELWKSDGTSAGTTLVKDILPGSDGVSPSNLTAADGLLYFAAYNSDSGYIDLWQSDGTALGTVLLLEGGASDLYYDTLYASGGLLYFANYDDIHGLELWRSDGTPTGTQFVKELDSNFGGSGVGRVLHVNRRLYYILYSGGPYGDSAQQIWMRAGVNSEAQLVAQLPEIYHIQSMGNALYVSGRDENGPALWKHNGETETLELVRRFEAAAPSNLTQLDEQLFFLASDAYSSDPIDQGVPIYDIWRTDGTPAGSIRLTQGAAGLYDGAPSAIFAGSFFVAGGRQLWVTDGTPAGTRNFTPAGIGSGIGWFINAPNALYFMTWNPFEVWHTNGVIEGTYKLSSAEEINYVSSETVNVNGAIFFVGHNQDTGAQLWYNNGSSSELVRLTAVTPPSRFASYYSQLQPVGEQLFFTIEDATLGPELWKSNGSPEGTMLVKDISPPELSTVPASYPGPLFEFGDLLFFGAHDGVHGKELWQSDGSADGTFMVKDINPGIASSTPQRFVGKGNIFFFTAIDGAHGRELWQSDGTANGTQLVTDLYAGFASAQPYPQLIFDNTLYFTADNGLDGQQLFGLLDPGIPLALPEGGEPSKTLPHQYYMPLINR